MDHWDMTDGVVELPDGRRVRGTGLRRPRGEAPVPDFAVYLRGRDPQVPDREYRWVRWRDFRLPDSTPEALAALKEAHARAATERVEIACGGGIGRTGTAMAVLAIMSGVAPDDAVAWVREHYHPRAVETRAQRRWIAEVSAASLGRGHHPAE
ncbi:protein-tyrosine phosphatase family protein [Promicromonospora sp. NPDC060204]|uniref:protein-tyrosine phosphatase family protein n=1 Tax=Promicromonospora sp. NPDC060204 TaxID=3347071 RepID=UPI0036672111